MATYRIQIKGLEELKKSFSKASDVIKDNFGEAMRKSVELLKQKARRKAGSPPIVFEGNLADSIQARSTPFKGTVGAGVKYAGAIEFGTRPHFPPVAPLERWARLKLGKPGLGFVIARKISRVGTKAQPFFEPAIEESIRDIGRIFESAADQIVNQL